MRFRSGEWPSIDAFYAYQHGDNEQIENSFEPTKTTDVTLKAFGFAMGKPFNLAPIMDASIGVGYKRVRQDGIVEFRPAKTETINDVSVSGAASRFVGPNKVTLDGTFTYQDIEPDSVVAGGANSGDHNRYIYGATISYLAPYLLPKPIPFLLAKPSLGRADPFAQLYETRGLKLFTGFGHDFEAFGTTNIEKHDYFIGASVLGWQPLGNDVRRFRILSPPLFDFTLQPTIFTADVSDGNNEHNAQYRTDVSLVWTLLDEDRRELGDQDADRPRPLNPLDVAFVKLALPFRHDVAIQGTNSFENFRVGIALDAKILGKYSMSRRQILRLLLAVVAVSLPHRGRLFGPLLVMLATVPIGACSPKYADQSSIYPMQRDCVGLACPPLPEQVAVMKDAWDAFNNGYFDQATKKVDEVINTWGPKATEEQKNLCHHLNEPGFQVPHEGVVPAIEADRIRSFGLLNEVAQAWWLKGRILERTGHLSEAQEAYQMAIQFPHGMVCDPKYKGYWSPALDARARLQTSLELEEMCAAYIMTSYGEALASPSSMEKIWRAYNADSCEEAVSVAKKLIKDVGPCATRLQKQMKDRSLPEPKTGPVASKEEKELILRQGVVNDVGAAWYVIGRCTARNEEKRDQAIKAFEESLQYPYARVYDPSNGGFFWSPAEDARARLEFLQR